MMIINFIGAIIFAFIAFWLLYHLAMDSVEERVRKIFNEEKKEINMTVAKMNKINEWMSHLDQQTMDLSDQLEVTQATMEYLAKLEPIYDKYTGSTKETRYR